MGAAAFKNSVYFVFFPIILLLYLFVVISGYSIGLSKSFPDIDSRVSILIAAAIGLTIWTMAVFVARLHAYDASHTTAKFIKIALFLVLLSVSALGIINAAFFYFEGATVLRQAVERSEKRVADLRSRSNDLLPAREFIATRDKVMSLVAQLQSEVENGGTLQGGVQLCGVGSKAKNAIEQIRTDLPSYTTLRGSESGFLNCRDRVAVSTVSQQYKQNAETMLTTIPLYSESRVAERQQLQLSIDKAAKEFEARFSKLRQDIASLSIVPHQESPAVQRIVGELEVIESEYSNLVRQLIGILKLPAQSFPETLEMDSARKIGSFISTLDVISDRILTGQASVATVIYILIPILFDLLLIAIIYVVLTRVRKPGSASGRIYKDRVRYILPPMPD
jgi:hypothetical protein